MITTTTSSPPTYQKQTASAPPLYIEDPIPSAPPLYIEDPIPSAPPLDKALQAGEEASNFSISQCLSRIHEWIRPTNPLTGQHELRIMPLLIQNGLDYISSKLWQPAYSIDTKHQQEIEKIAQLIFNEVKQIAPHIDFKVTCLSSNNLDAWHLSWGSIHIPSKLLQNVDTYFSTINKDAEVQKKDVYAAIITEQIAHCILQHKRKRTERFFLILLAYLGTIIATCLSFSSSSKNKKKSKKEENSNDRNKKMLLNASRVIFKWVWEGNELILGHNQSYQADYYGMILMQMASHDPKGSLVLERTYLQIEADRPWYSRCRRFLFPTREERADETKPTHSKRLIQKEKMEKLLQKEGMSLKNLKNKQKPFTINWIAAYIQTAEHRW